MKPLFALASACALLVATPVFACSEAGGGKDGQGSRHQGRLDHPEEPATGQELNEQLRQRQEARSEQNRPSDCDAYAQMLKELDQEEVTYSATLRSDPPVRGAVARDGEVRRP